MINIIETTAEPLALRPRPGKKEPPWKLTWPNTRMRLSASAPIEHSAEPTKKPAYEAIPSEKRKKNLQARAGVSPLRRNQIGLPTGVDVRWFQG